MPKKPKIEIKKPQIDRKAIKRSVDLMKRKQQRKKEAPAGMSAPDFWAMLDDPDVGDPFGEFEIGETVEETANEEVEVMSEALQRIIAEKKERRRKYAMLTDASYYVSVVFQTVDQKIEFMKKANWDALQDNFEWMMINGLELADLMGIELEPVYIPKKDPPKAPVSLRDKKIIIGGENE